MPALTTVLVMVVLVWSTAKKKGDSKRVGYFGDLEAASQVAQHIIHGM